MSDEKQTGPWRPVKLQGLDLYALGRAPSTDGGVDYIGVGVVLGEAKRIAAYLNRLEALAGLARNIGTRTGFQGWIRHEYVTLGGHKSSEDCETCRALMDVALADARAANTDTRVVSQPSSPRSQG